MVLGFRAGPSIVSREQAVGPQGRKAMDEYHNSHVNSDHIHGPLSPFVEIAHFSRSI